MSEFVEKVLQETNIASTPGDAVALLRERTGLLFGPGSYSFVHKSVGEFLVVQAVLPINALIPACPRICCAGKY